MLVHCREQPNNASNGCRGRGRKRPARERRWLTWIPQSITGCVSVTFTGHGPPGCCTVLWEAVGIWSVRKDCRIQLVSGKEWRLRKVLVFRSFYDRSLDQVAFTWKFLWQHTILKFRQKHILPLIFQKKKTLHVCWILKSWSYSETHFASSLSK